MNNIINNIINIKGVVGEIGDKGDRGIVGYPGTRGFIGDKGDKGLKGYIGCRGIQGEYGFQGERGVEGFEGDIGEDGDEGEKGYIGPKGEKGEKGDKGQRGICHPQIGPKGNKGSRGPRGSPATNEGLLNNDLYLAKKGEKGENGLPGNKGIESVWLTDFHFFSDYIGNSDINGFSENIHIEDPLKYGFYSSPGGNKILNIHNKNKNKKETNLTYKCLSYYKLELNNYLENFYFKHIPTSTFSYNLGELDKLSYNFKQENNTGKIQNTYGIDFNLWARVEIHCQNTSGKPALNYVGNELNNDGIKRHSPDYISWRTLEDFSEWFKIDRTSGIIELSTLEWVRGYDELNTVDNRKKGNLRNINKTNYHYLDISRIKSNNAIENIDEDDLPEEYISYNYDNKRDLEQVNLGTDYISIYNEINSSSESSSKELYNNLKQKIEDKRDRSMTNNKIYNGQSIAINYCFSKPVRYNIRAINKNHIKNISETGDLILDSVIEEHTFDFFSNIEGDNGIDQSLLKTEFKFKEINFSVSIKVLK
jgi:hypothetical protein